MAHRASPWIRSAGAGDAVVVAALHADSWRRHYRGAYADKFLDEDVEDDRLEVWTARLAKTDGHTVTLLAEDGDGLVGFAHVIFDDDPMWGSLLDNLHVTYARKGGGIGRLLITEAARAVVEHGPGAMYLWVLDQNLNAQAFYRNLGGKRVHRRLAARSPGRESRLNGRPAGWRYAWDEPALRSLLESLADRTRVP